MAPLSPDGSGTLPSTRSAASLLELLIDLGIYYIITSVLLFSKAHMLSLHHCCCHHHDCHHFCHYCCSSLFMFPCQHTLLMGRSKVIKKYPLQKPFNVHNVTKPGDNIGVSQWLSSESAACKARKGVWEHVYFHHSRLLL